MSDWLLAAKASLRGAFFVSGLLVFSQVSIADCTKPKANSTQARVQFVSDGDTVVLSDQRRVRLIGINTPELGRKGTPNQPFAIHARNHLRQLLFTHHNEVRLNPGQQQQDRHGRWLAHLYLPDGRHLGEQLLREGHGWMVAIAPNLSAADCLKAAELEARTSRRGIWADPAYAPTESTALKLRTRGFHYIQGRIKQVIERDTALWIKLDGRFNIHIPKTALVHFKSQPTSDWVGRKIAVRGWLYASRGELHVNLEHPAALDILGASAAEHP